SPGSAATMPTSATPTSRPVALPFFTTSPRGSSCSTPPTGAIAGSRRPGRTSSASWAASAPRSWLAVEAERMTGRVEQHAHVVLRLVLGERRAQSEGVVHRCGQVGDLDVEVELLARPSRLRRPHRGLVDVGLLHGEIGHALAEVEGTARVVLL